MLSYGFRYTRTLPALFFPSLLNSICYYNTIATGGAEENVGKMVLSAMGKEG